MDGGHWVRLDADIHRYPFIRINITRDVVNDNDPVRDRRARTRANRDQSMVNTHDTAENDFRPRSRRILRTQT
jgi:hypothetical protein